MKQSYYYLHFTDEKPGAENLSNFPSITVRTNQREIQFWEVIYSALYNMLSEVSNNHVSLVLSLTTLLDGANAFAGSSV